MLVDIILREWYNYLVQMYTAQLGQGATITTRNYTVSNLTPIQVLVLFKQQVNLSLYNS